MKINISYEEGTDLDHSLVLDSVDYLFCHEFCHHDSPINNIT